MSINTVKIAAGQALDALRSGWEAQRGAGLKVSYMLHGRPGVGKSEIVQQLAGEIGARLFDLRLTTIEPQDLRGLPYYDHEAGRTVWYRPEDLPDDPDRPSVLFLDELTAASPYLQPTVYGLLQERRVGRHRLPDSVFIVAAGNTVEDGAIAYDMGTALSDRLVHLHVVARPGDWLENYAVPRGLHPAVTAFIRTRPDLLDTTEAALGQGHLIACTPRSWTRVSDILKTRPERGLRDVLVAGVVGDAVAAEFALVADDVAATVRVDEMLAETAGNRLAMYPASLHGLTALVHGLVGALDAQTAGDVIDIMDGVRGLARARSGEGFEALPLAELATYGFEALMRKALDDGLEAEFAGSETFQAYMREREADGLSG